MPEATYPARFEPLVEATKSLSERFEKAGYRLYLVGGSVRDALIDAEADPAGPSDLDLTTNAHPDEIERLVAGWADAVWTQGKRFGTIGAKHQGRTYDSTTHRAESYAPDSRKPEVEFGDSVDVDLSRRDFTINAMALALPSMELVDPFGGLGDLIAKKLRTPLDPRISFDDDPLRMLRAARFAARFAMTPEPALVEAMREMAGRLAIVSAERIRDELDRLVMLRVPSVIGMVRELSG